MKRVLSFLLPILTILSVLFIFSNSLSSGAEALEKKSFVVETVERIIEFFTGKEIDSHAETLTVVSKIAHVVEFAFFSFLLTASIFHFGGNIRKQCERILFAGVLVALADEHLQSFSQGRYSSVRDVLIDLAGIFLGYWIFSLLIYFIHRSKQNVSGSSDT